ncbi:MAG: glycosyltransferase family 2 protein [Candidatus Diapherotrites archaeon]|uniref:Glycosyltransferase family 2 protein n=1 Tax=Candidatus Iainarchaeum sp. TaxID=3101447 RepID=A0A8T4KZZ1_9ARCH|nr:glycosyltransferase family 2 protein [Candidatus Diapherotrites archaeon]
MAVPLASVLIPTRNAGKEFEKVLSNVFAQKKAAFEVLIADTESVDETLEIASRFKVKVKKIRQAEFGHGRTRNMLASMAKGDFLVFLTQDSIPRQNLWLYSLIKNFEDKKVAGVYGRQVTKENAFPMEEFFYMKKYGGKRVLWDRNSWREKDVVFSSANCAIRKKVFQERQFNPELIVSEDYEWAYNAMDRGYSIVYEPKAETLHSHNYGLAENFRKHFDIGYSYSQIYSRYDSLGFAFAGVKFFFEEQAFLARSKKLLWMPYAAAYLLTKFLGVSLGRIAKFFPKRFCMIFSGQKYYWSRK